jgi:plasmid stability protein
MAQLLVRKIDDALKEKIRAQAKAKGRSLEEEARAILRDGVAGGRPPVDDDQYGCGTRINRRFANIGLTDDEFAEFEKTLSSMRGSPVRPAEFE